MPKKPREDPSIAREQAAQRQRELDRLAEEKDKATKAARRGLPSMGPRSLLSPGNAGGGFDNRGSGNYTA